MRLVPDSKECPHCHEFYIPGGAYASHVQSCANGGSKRRKRSRYREIFFAHNGPEPYACHFGCGREVTFTEVIVHHIDEDHTNNDVVNLSPAHRSCHNQYHFKQLWQDRREELVANPIRGNRKPHSEETKRKISETKKARGQAPTPEARAAGNLARSTRANVHGGDVL